VHKPPNNVVGLRDYANVRVKRDQRARTLCPLVSLSKTKPCQFTLVQLICIALYASLDAAWFAGVRTRTRGRAKWNDMKQNKLKQQNYSLSSRTLRAITAGPGETFSRDLSGEFFLIFLFKMRVLVYFISLATAKPPPNNPGPEVTYSPTPPSRRTCLSFQVS